MQVHKVTQIQAPIIFHYNPTNTANTGSSGASPSSNTNNGSTVSTDSYTSSNTNTSATGTPEIDDATQIPVPTIEETTADEGQQIFSINDDTIDIGGGQPAREVRGGNALIWTLVGLIVTLNLWWFFVARIKKKSQ